MNGPIPLCPYCGKPGSFKFGGFCAKHRIDHSDASQTRADEQYLKWKEERDRAPSSTGETT